MTYAVQCPSDERAEIVAFLQRRPQGTLYECAHALYRRTANGASRTPLEPDAGLFGEPMSEPLGDAIDAPAPRSDAQHRRLMALRTKAFGRDDAAYRAFLRETAGVSSSTALDFDGAQRVIEALEERAAS